MRARDIIIVVVARVDRVSSLAGSIGTPRDARARSKDEGWIGSIFLRAVASRVGVETRRSRSLARSRSTSIGAAIDRDRSIHRRARASTARARRGIERGIERARLTNEIFSLKRTAPSSPRRLPSPPPPPPCSSPGPRTRKSSAWSSKTAPVWRRASTSNRSTIRVRW